MLKYHIQTVEVGSGGSANLLFTNIPQIYDDLLLVTSLRDNVASGGWENAFIYPNNSSANMASRFLYGFSTTTGTGVNNPAVIYHQTARGNNTANTFSNSSVLFCGYTSSENKRISAETSVERNDAAAINAITEALWSSSVPITSLTIAAASGSFVQYSYASLYGIKRGADGSVNGVATGGTVTTSGGYTIHTFTSSGTFTVNRNLNVDYVVIGGGGAGASGNGGGGGAGGYRTSFGTSGGNSSAESSASLTSGTSYAVTVGAGGTVLSGYPQNGNNGSDSVFGGIVSIGGGGGKSTSVNGASGGAGGGGGGSVTIGGSGTTGQGFNGGNGADVGGQNPAGGGGGAGAAGVNGSGSAGGAGGAGISSTITGASVTRAGGGGGAVQSGGGGAGGAGGGGAGGGTGTAGTTNTGSGGGGGGATGSAANGGSGVVIIRYLTPA